MLQPALPANKLPNAQQTIQSPRRRSSLLASAAGDSISLQGQPVALSLPKNVQRRCARQPCCVKCTFYLKCVGIYGSHLY